MTHGAAFDVQAVCAGFVYALAIADNFLKLGQARAALVIGAETFSRILDWDDRSTCVLFGDGAGAVVLRAGSTGDGPKARGILSTHLHSDGRFYDLLYVDGGPSTTGTTGHVRMSGPEVFRHAVVKLAEVVDEALGANGLTAADIDWLVPHQANKRIIDGTAKKLGLPRIEDHSDRRRARQHLGRVDSAGARRGLRRRPDQARSAGADRGDRRRAVLGVEHHPLVTEIR